MKNKKWLVLSFSLPAKSQAIRVKVWRRLQAIGAIQAKNSLYVLPVSVAHTEHFTWLAKEVEEAEGEALFFETEAIRNLDDQAIMDAFARERDAEYAGLDEELHAALALARGKDLASLDRELLSTRRKCGRRLEAIRSRDFFPSGKGDRTAALLHELSALLDGRDTDAAPAITTVGREDYVGKTWITRQRPYVDRLATIWAVRRFIDPDARLVFVPHDAKVDKSQDAVWFDMPEAEFTHRGGRITFEVVIASFELAQEVPAGLVATLRAIDLEEMETAPTEAAGLKRILDGLLATLRDDEQLVAAALPLFDALSATYKPLRGDTAVKDTAIQVAQLMAASARTAPKAGGKDFLEIAVITVDGDLQKIAAAMRDYAPKSTNEAFWLRDASNIENCQALVLVGLGKSLGAGYDCGACGFATCTEFLKHRQTTEKDMGYSGPHCVMRMMDIGAALVSAAKTASLLNLDNRVQQRVGAAARALGYIKAEVAMGIPVGFYGKSIFFDRAAPKH